MREEPSDPTDDRVADALERVAHGAVVSVPSILVERLLTLAFTALLTNGFSAAAYGLFVLARRCQFVLVSLTNGFGTGLSRYLPNADTATERDIVATIGSLLGLSAAVVFGSGLYLATPVITDFAGTAPRFGIFLRVFAVALPATVALQTAVALLRGLEEVGPLNLTQRLGFPAAQLVVAGIAVATDTLLVAAIGAPVVAALAGLTAIGWLGRKRGLRPRLRGTNASRLHRQYARYTAPVFAGSIATTVQRLGFYPLIAVFLSGTAGGVFAVGALVGMLVRLPLMGINQFMPPVAAALHGSGHRDALSAVYGATSRLVLVGVTALAVPVVVFRHEVMTLFGPTFVTYADLLPAFVLAQWVACAAGSVGILLMMTDHQRALLVVNTAITAGLAILAIPLVRQFGLVGVVIAYLLMLTINNTLEVLVLYRLEGLQPLTRAHIRPLVAAVPLATVALVARTVAPGPVGALVGTLVGVAAYAGVLLWLGFAPVERRLVATLVDRYRGVTSLRA
ncbi:polysaccharide biosynthesis C-terminal domain-containing protein [Halosegnis sp.]|uniref:polysaccharide biosynthesis C-terminal domain-containing protein n=1 Tax=Halosegnis sp. TaxID=2864959 RepID=UPI0035D49092